MAEYVHGLPREIKRKNGWSPTEAAGDTGREDMHLLLKFYPWNTDGLRDDVREVVFEAIRDPEAGALIVDKTGFLKKDT